MEIQKQLKGIAKKIKKYALIKKRAMFPFLLRRRQKLFKQIKTYWRNGVVFAKENTGRLLPIRFRRAKEKIDCRALAKWTVLLLSLAVLLTLSALDSGQNKQQAADKELKDKVGQMLMVGFRGANAPKDSYIAKAIPELSLGGVILFDYDVATKSFGRNIVNPEQTKQLVADLKSYATGQSLLVAVDAEGGNVNRLKPALGFISLPSAKDVATKAGIGSALEYYWDLAKQLAVAGVNVNFAPVVDLDVNEQNPVIGAIGRSYSADPAIVEIFAKAFIAAHRSFGVITALKHFPGHGSSTGDSHLGMADVTDTYQDRELDPYEKLIADNAVDAVMTAHVIDRRVDPEFPATLSSKFIQNILREKLNFDGVVFSDDMQMAAIIDNYVLEDAIVRAINAGCDILVFANNSANYDESIPYRVRDAILQAVRDGRISRDRIDQASARIMKLKNPLPHIDKPKIE